MAENDLDPTGSTEQTTDSTSTSQVDPYTQSIRKGLLEGAYQTLNQPGPYYYPGQMVAGFAPETQAAQYLQTQHALGNYYQNAGLGDLGTQLVSSPMYAQGYQNAMGALGALTDPRMMYAESNPYLQSAMQAAMRPTIDAFGQQIMPQIRSSAQMTGGYGGSRQGVAEGLAAGQTSRNIMDINSQMAYQNYLNSQKSMMQGAALTPSIANYPLQGFGTAQQLNQVPYQDIAALDAVGQQKQALAQNYINSELQRYMYNNQVPLDKLALYGNIVNSTPAMGQTTTGTSSTNAMYYGLTPQTNPLSSMMGGAFGGALLGPMLGIGGGWGALAGAGLGLLGGLFG